jgi:hypothetical protein
MADMIRSYPLDMLTIGDRDHTVMRRMRGRRTMTLKRKPQKPALLIVRSTTAEILREIKEKTTPAWRLALSSLSLVGSTNVQEKATLLIVRSVKAGIRREKYKEDEVTLPDRHCNTSLWQEWKETGNGRCRGDGEERTTG